MPHSARRIRYLATSSLLICLGWIASAPLAPAQRPAAPNGLTRYFSGSLIDSAAGPVGGPALLLMGGGSEVTQAYATHAYPIVNGGDIVVLRTSGGDGYQSYLFSQIPVVAALRPNSVETLVVNTRAKANLDYVRYALDHAEMIWFAGGDQSDYVESWRGTAVETALRAAWARGAVLGGTSAGAQILGEYIYDPGSASAVTSAQAVANPYRSGITITTDFISPHLSHDTVVDVHFANRDRMGRLLTFMARLRQDAVTSRITGIGIDENTSLFINSSGLGIVQRQSGSGHVYVLREDRLDTVRERVAPGQSLLYSRVRRTRLTPGQTYDFTTGLNTGTTTLLDVAGSVPANPY